VIAADITDEAAAQRILAGVHPDILVLNAGAIPRMGRLDQISWADFSAPWETDVKGGLYWIQAALNLPLATGVRVVATSMGGARSGSPLSGGYAGAKHMLWLMAKYANGVAEQKGLGIRFQVVVPQQMIAGTVSATRIRRLRPGDGHRARGVPSPVRRAHAAAPIRAITWSRCWTIRSTPKASPSGSRVMTGSRSSRSRRREHRPGAPAKHAELLALATELRPELHRYSARLMGSVIEGEDVVQDTFARAFAALDELKEAPPLRPWLFRIAHNRAMDLLRGRAIRAAEPIDEVPEIVDPDSPDPAELLMRREAV